jgi:hypothetical protein
MDTSAAALLMSWDTDSVILAYCIYADISRQAIHTAPIGFTPLSYRLFPPKNYIYASTLLTQVTTPLFAHTFLPPVVPVVPIFLGIFVSTAVSPRGVARIQHT